MNKTKFEGAKSICYCGHTGDGQGSQHLDRFMPGHGKCNVKDCNCVQFTWKKRTPKYEEVLKIQKEEGK